MIGHAASSFHAACKYKQAVHADDHPQARPDAGIPRRRDFEQLERMPAAKRPPTGRTPGCRHPANANAMRNNRSANGPVMVGTIANERVA